MHRGRLNLMLGLLLASQQDFLLVRIDRLVDLLQFVGELSTVVHSYRAAACRIGLQDPLRLGVLSDQFGLRLLQRLKFV